MKNIKIEEGSFIVLSVLMMLLVTVTILYLYTLRILESYRSTSRKKLQLEIQRHLNSLVALEIQSASMFPAAFDFKMNELKAVIRNSRFSKQVLIDQILDFNKILTGNNLELLSAICRELKLTDRAMEKVFSNSWITQREGIREIAGSGDQSLMFLLEDFINSSNAILREESILGIVKLDPGNPFSFLDNLHEGISPWVKINVFHHLQKIDPRRLPLFSTWYLSDNIDIVLFSISLTRQFKQAKAIPHLLNLLHHPVKKVVGITIDTLGELGANPAAMHIDDLAIKFWNNEKLSRRIANCLGKIGDPRQHAMLLKKYTFHKNYEVRFEAAKSLKKLGLAESFATGGETIPPDYNSILTHLNEPLLRNT